MAPIISPQGVDSSYLTDLAGCSVLVAFGVCAMCTLYFLGMVTIGLISLVLVGRAEATRANIRDQAFELGDVRVMGLGIPLGSLLVICYAKLAIWLGFTVLWNPDSWWQPTAILAGSVLTCALMFFLVWRVWDKPSKRLLAV